MRITRVHSLKHLRSRRRVKFTSVEARSTLISFLSACKKKDEEEG